MDEQDPAQQALMKMFRQDQAEASSGRKPRGRRSPLAHPWLLAIAVVVVVLGPAAFLVIYPRFGPVDTMTSFCMAEGDAAYDTAYALLSKHAQQHVSLDAFTQASRDAKLSSCAVSNGIPFIFGGTQASLDTNFQVTNSSGATAIGGSMTFVREHGEWRVDSMNPDLLNLSS